MNKILYTYTNWWYKTSIYDDWTKIREWEWEAAFPENIDIKITNYCDAWCWYCHERSTTEWKHWDIDWMIEKLSEIVVPWMELAIWWWNPLDHPHLVRFLSKLKSMWFIPNLTVNSLHYHMLTDDVLNNIYWLWVSYAPWLTEKFPVKSNTVIHTIAWVHTPKQIEWLLSLWHKVLILWFKLYWRWKTFHSDRVDKNIELLRLSMKDLLWKWLISFDNLALDQLQIKKHYTKKTWDSKFMWHEWTFTMYIDAVEKQYWIASSLPERYSMENIILSFSHVKDDYKKRMSIWN